MSASFPREGQPSRSIPLTGFSLTGFSPLNGGTFIPRDFLRPRGEAYERRRNDVSENLPIEKSDDAPRGTKP